MLNPFAVHFAYGQVAGYAAQKVFGFEQEPDLAPQIAVDFVAVPFEVYPYDYFRPATITVIRTEDETALAIMDRYTDTRGAGIPNVLSWQVAGWSYDTFYEVEISNIAMQSGETQSYSYPVLIERGSLQQ